MEQTIRIIKSKLTPALLPKRMHERNIVNPMYGHCYHSSATLKWFYPHLKLHKGRDWEEQWHWWCVDVDGTIIDITAEQYTSVQKPLPYSAGMEVKELWQRTYKNRVKRLIRAVEMHDNNKWFNY